MILPPASAVSAGQAAVGVAVGLSVNPMRSAGYLAPLALLGAFAVVLVLALVARRLLGLQGGLIRTLLCAVLGLAVGGSLLGPHLDTTAETAALFPVMVGVQLLTTVLALLVIDAILPRRSPAAWVKDAQHRTARARRYAQVTTIATRNGLVRQVRTRPHFGDHDRNAAFARSLRRTLTSAPSATSTPSCRARCSPCCWPSTSEIPPRSGTPCSRSPTTRRM